MLRSARLLIALVLSTTLASIFTSNSYAGSEGMPAFADSPYDLINAVNDLRSSNGLAPYSINPILMSTAQSQADFMAATGTVSHSGPGGTDVTDRLLAAGYPLAGDLSQGGFRSENITSGGENMPAQSAVDSWTGDAPHLNTMLSSNLTEIGAGVAVSGGRVYFVIDCARPISGGAPQASTSVTGGGSAIPAGEAIISVAIVSTPNANGDVIHEVKYGQTLWQISLAYHVKLEEVKTLNNLQDDNIYPGNKLLIKKSVVLPTASLFPIPTREKTEPASLEPGSTATLLAPAPGPTSTVTPINPAVPNSNTNITWNLMGIIAVALLGGGIFVWLGGSKKE